MSKTLVKKIIKAAHGIGFLATIDGTTPRVRPMACQLTNENVLWSATFSKSRKMKQLKDAPRAEICFMDDKMQHVRLSGRIKVITDLKKKRAFYKKNPDLKQYFASPDDESFVMLEMKPTKVELMGAGEMKYAKVSM